MPRRGKQLRSSCHQSCCGQAAAGRSEISVLATSNSSRASGNNASTPTRLATATREAHATKRKFEYKAHLLRSEFWPPSGAKTTPLWRDYVRARELGQPEMKPCLTVRRGGKSGSCKGDGSPDAIPPARPPAQPPRPALPPAP